MTIYGTIIFYIVILVICCILANLADKKNNKKFLLPIIIILSTIAGLRHYTVGIDTEPYMISIENFFKTREMSWRYTSFSQGYGYFIIFFYNIWHNYNFLLLIEALIINSLILIRFWDFRDKSSFSIMTFIYLMVVYLRTFNLNVQYISLAMVFYATRFLEKGKYLKYFIWIALAGCLHTSALIGILYFVIKWYNLKDITPKGAFIRYISIAVGALIGFKLYGIMFNRYSKYFTGSESNIGLMVFVQLFIYVLTLIFSKHIFFNETELDKKIIFKKVSLYYFIGIIASFSSYVIKNAGRISYYFMIFEPVFFGMVIKDTKTDKMYKMMVLLWIISYSMYVFVDTFKSTGYFPYSFFWM